MAKLKLAIWCEPGQDRADFLRALVEHWAAGVLERPEIDGLVLYRVDPSRGRRAAIGSTGDSMCDAAISLWLDDAGLGAFREEVGRPASAWRPAGAGRVDAWLVSEVRAKIYDRSWPDGVASPGIAQVSLVRPARDHGREQCSRYWREQHVPLALRVHVGLWNYVQDHVRETFTETGGDVLGHAVLHFRNEDDLREKLFDSEAGAREIYADLPHFMSLADSQTALMTELILRTPRDHLG